MEQLLIAARLAPFSSTETAFNEISNCPVILASGTFLFSQFLNWLLSAERNQFKNWLNKNVPDAKITGQFDISLNAVSVELNGASLAAIKSCSMEIGRASCRERV